MTDFAPVSLASEALEPEPSIYQVDKLVVSFPKSEASELVAKRLPGVALGKRGLGLVLARQGYWIATLDHPSHPDHVLPFLLVISSTWTKALGFQPTIRLNRLDICCDFNGPIDAVVGDFLPCAGFIQADGRPSWLLVGKSNTNFSLVCYDKGLQRGGRRDQVGRIEARANRGGIDCIFDKYREDPRLPYCEKKCPLSWAAALRGLIGHCISMVELRTRRVLPILVPGWAVGDRQPSAEAERRRRVAALKRAIVASESLDVQLALLAELRKLTIPDSRLQDLVEDFEKHLNRST